MKKSITSFLIFALAFAMQAQTSQEIPSASTVGTLTVKATTVTFNGDHAPKNYLGSAVKLRTHLNVKFDENRLFVL